MTKVPLPAAVMAGALLAATCADGCNGYFWWSSLAARPVEPWTILSCRRLSTTAVIIPMPLEQLVLFHQRCYYLLW